MNSLILRLSGPLQSWGTQSRFRHRDTAREPSKSGVVGLLACALGRPRGAALDDLFGLSLAVRVDREGTVQCDYQTAGGGNRPDGSRYGIAKSSGKSGDPLPSQRLYLADADFRVALSGTDLDWLRRLAEAVEHPHWPLCLGRRAFVPDPGLCRGVREGLDGVTALREEPWFRRNESDKNLPQEFRYIVEVPRAEVGGEIRHDVTRSFAERAFELRRVRVERYPLSSTQIQPEENHVSVATEA